MRKLASVRKISNIRPIEGADMIEVATVDNWNVVVKKNEFQIGDLAVYFEIDSFLPVREEFEFLRKSSYKVMADGSVGFRLKTIRLRGQVSQGLIVPLSTLPTSDYIVGDDVTEILGVLKYEAPIPAELSGSVIGPIPSCIQKTDEERIQNLTAEYEDYKRYKFFASEKVDGTSTTIFLSEHLFFGVCGRNWQYEYNPDNTYWKVAIHNNLEEKMRKLNRNLAIQGEIVGEGVQSNKYKLIGQRLLVFNIFDIDKHEYLSKEEMLEICKIFGLQTVPTILTDFTLTETIDELLEIANDRSMVFPGTIREGLVWVSIDSPRRISFKTISNKFLLKYED